MLNVRHLISGVALVGAAGLAHTAGGCALVVGADFSERGEASDAGVDPDAATPEGGTCPDGSQPAAEDCSTAQDDENCDGTPVCDGAAIHGGIFGNDNDQAEVRVIVAPDRSVYLALETIGSMDYGGSAIGTGNQQSIHIAKFTPTLEHVWSFTTQGSDFAHDLGDIVVDASGNLVLVGSFLGTFTMGDVTFDRANERAAFVAKLDPTGPTGPKVLWVRDLRGQQERFGKSVTVAPDGGIVVVGWYRGSLVLHDGAVAAAASDGADLYVVKYDAGGNVHWSRTFGGGGDQDALGVDCGPDSEVVLVGLYRGGITLGAQSMQGLSGGRESGFLVLLNKDGDYQRHRFFAGEASSQAIDVVVEASKRVLVTGYYQGDSLDFGQGAGMPSAVEGLDAFLAAYQLDDLAPLWTESFGGQSEDIGFRIEKDTEGHVLLTGAATSTIQFSDGGMLHDTNARDGFVVKLDPSRPGGPGREIWSQLIGGEGAQTALDVAAGPLGEVYAVGYTGNWFPIAPSSTPEREVRERDVWIAALRP